MNPSLDIESENNMLKQPWETGYLMCINNQRVEAALMGH